MTDTTDAWRVFTPFGPLVVDFPDAGPARLLGDSLAVDHLLQLMTERTNAMGMVMTPENLEPHDLYHFCQVDGVTVIAPDDFDGNPEEDPMSFTLDDAGGPTLSALRASLKITTGVRARLAIVAQMVAMMPAAAAKNIGARTETDPTALNDVSAADEAVANGERPRRSTSQLYDFDPNRRHSQRKRDNAAAMALLAKIDAGDLDPAHLTDEQRAALAKYSGTGGGLQGVDGKKGSAYEYYTPKPIAEAMWALLGELGFAGGKALDPCAAVGVFGATAPVNTAIDACELNETSGRINALVNDGPGYKAVVSPFEAVAAATPDEAYDAVVTNVPFGTLSDRGGNNFKDPRYQKEPIQNYFILRSLEKLRPGGLAAFITPPRCVSGKGGKEEDLRYRASLIAEFLGAYRLPNKVFGTADADTITDVIVFRKFGRDALDKVAELKEQNPKALVDANVLWQEFIGGDYFKGEGRRYVIGEMGKGMGKFGEIDVLNSDLSVADIAKLLRKFPGSRIDWDALQAVESAPLVYRDGDTMMHAGQTLEMRDGRWVALDSVAAGDNREERAAVMGNLATALDAVTYKVTWEQALDAHDWMADSGQAIYMPDWLRGTVKALKRLPAAQRATYWGAGTAGIAALEVMGRHQAEEEGFNYLAEYAELSAKIERVAVDAKKAPTALSGVIRDGLARIGVIYSKKAGFNAVWRGDVVTDKADTRTEGERVEALKYQNGSLFVSVADAKAIYGEDFDPMASADWCVGPDGQTVAKASDYYVGNYADFLRRIDAQIEAATDGTVKDKLLRQKLQADTLVDRVDPAAMSFNLFSPFVTLEEKADFLRRFVDPRFAMGFDDAGKAEIILDIKAAENERDKLLRRMALYLKNGTHTLGSAEFGDEKRAMASLRTMTQTANEQFNTWVKANPAVMARLHKTANDPERLYFRQVDDESPMDIPGLNPAWKLHGYQNAYIRKVTRDFGGINGFGVGLGKTSTALAAVAYVQSIGVKQKTIFVVPNSVLSNWRKEAGRVYANTDDCLFVGLTQKGDAFKVDSKQYDADLMRILENRHAKIFMTMEAFQRLRLREETARDYDIYLASVDSSYADSDLNRKSEQAKSRREALIHQLTTDSAKSAAAPFFEDLGIDSVVMDEAHAYKNAAEVNEFKGGKFLSLASASARGLDAQAKAWYVRKTTGDRGDGVVCLTATPVTNSPLEIYSMLSLATGHKKLNDLMMGIKGADHFMETMCVLENSDEETIDGTIKAYDVFTGLANVNILRGALHQVATIKNAEDVGAQIKVPHADEQAVAVDLPGDVVDTLQDYKNAFRFALDTIMEKDIVRGDAAAYDRVAAKFGEPMELIAHPFNLINKMTALIQDKELDDRATFYTFGAHQLKIAESVVADYNAKAPTEDRPREGPHTRPDAVVGSKTKRDGDRELTLLRIKALARIEGARIIIDTISPDTQARFEAIADKAGLDLDVSVPPKLAAMLDNFQKEEASPRGVGEEGTPTGRVKQIIFCDVLALHGKIKRLLIKRCGVAAGSIAIITGTVNGKPEEIIDVQDGFNAEGDDNRYRVIIANEKAEVGINLQKGTQAIHHLTIGWTPDSLTQRNGRGVRQGNKTDRVTVYHYDADGTFDTYKRMLVGKKSNWIDAVMDPNGGDAVDIEGGLSRQQLEELIESIGDGDAMGRIQERAAAAERAARAATNQAKQVVNLQTAIAQGEFLAQYDKPILWAADKFAQLYTLRAQLGALEFRLTNPKLTAATLVKTQNLLAEVKAKVEGLTRTLSESVKVFSQVGYGDKATKGEELAFGTILARAVGHVKRGEKPEEKIKAWFRNGYGYIFEVEAGSAVENEWQAESDMARQMVAEARKEFAHLAERDGGYSAAVLDRLDDGNAVIIDGKVVCTGAFIRTKSGLLTVVRREQPRYGAATLFVAAGIDAEALAERRESAADALRGGAVVLPGAAGYDECITEAAAIEDRAVSGRESVNASVMERFYSAYVPEVAQRRKARFQIRYQLNEWSLPHPHFPKVVMPDQAERGDVLRAIFDSQKAIVKAHFSDYPVGFALDSTEAPTRGSDVDATHYVAYAKAHGLRFTVQEAGTVGIHRLAELMEPGALETFGPDVIEAAQNADQLAQNLEAWLRKALPVLNLDTDPKFMVSPVAFLDHLILQRMEYNRRLAAFSAGKTVEQAVQSEEVDPNRLVGVTGDTKRWKDQIKSCAALAGGRAIWDGNAECWNVPFKGWEKLIAMHPTAADALQVVESSGKTAYGGYRRRR